MNDIIPLSIAILATGILAFDQPVFNQTDTQVIQNDRFGIVIDDHTVDVVINSTQSIITVDSMSWSGGVSINYLIKPTDDRPMQTFTDLNADGTTDLRMTHWPTKQSTVIEIRVNDVWQVIESIDKTARTAAGTDGNRYAWSIDAGWQRHGG